jgi:hypothetical protein
MPADCRMTSRAGWTSSRTRSRSDQALTGGALKRWAPPGSRQRGPRAASPAESVGVKAIHCIMTDLARSGTRDGVDPTPSEAFEQQLQASLRDPSAFRPGLLSQNLPAWSRYFELANQGCPYSAAQLNCRLVPKERSDRRDCTRFVTRAVQLP